MATIGRGTEVQQTARPLEEKMADILYRLRTSVSQAARISAKINGAHPENGCCSPKSTELSLHSIADETRDALNELGLELDLIERGVADFTTERG